MKKIIEKVKRIMVLAILTIISFPKKIFANTAEEIVSNMKEPMGEILYGVPRTYEVISRIWKLAKTVIIPIVLIIGLIIYFKKSKSSKKKKIIILLVVIAITMLVYFIGDVMIRSYFM